MIIRFSQKDREEIDRIIKPLEQDYKILLDQLLSLPEEHFTVINGTAKPYSKEAIELSEKATQCRQKIWDTSTTLYTSIEDRRFKRIESNKSEILFDAIRQTNAIIANIATALHLNDTKLKPEEFTLYYKDTESLRRVWTAELYKCIVRAKGNIEQLDAQTVTDFIKKELHRHYEKLDTSDAGKLTRHIEQTVTEAIPQPKKLQSGYFKAFYDKRINAMSYLNRQFIEPTIYRDDQQIIQIPGISFGDFTFYFENIDNALIKLGVETHKIILYVVSIFTKQKPKDNIVYFSLDDYLNETRPELPQTQRREYKKRLKQYVDTIPTITIPYIYKIPRKDGKKGYIERKGRLALFPRAETDNVNMGLIKFSDELSKNLKKTSVAQYPKKIFHIKANDPNTYRIALALSERYSNFNNVNNGTENVIGINTLWQRTNLPSIEEAGSHYKRDVIEPIEGSLNKLRDTYGILKSWHYINPKKGDQTPQERKMTPREVESIRNDLIKWKDGYINYQMKEEIPNLIDNAKEYQRKQEIKLLEKREREAIKAAKALEKIKENSGQKN